MGHYECMHYLLPIKKKNASFKMLTEGLLAYSDNHTHIYIDTKFSLNYHEINILKLHAKITKYFESKSWKMKKSYPQHIKPHSKTNQRIGLLLDHLCFYLLFLMAPESDKAHNKKCSRHSSLTKAVSKYKDSKSASHFDF